MYSIARQNLNEDFGYELILVDNASTDNTQKVAVDIWSESGSANINLVIAFEPKPGLTNARKKGINVARYEYLIFCDDDNWLDENYFKNVATLFDNNSQVAILGGTGIAHFEEESIIPPWFDKFYHGYAIGKQADTECVVNGVYGAGMAARKSIITQVFDSLPMFLQGRIIKQLTSGEDGEICYRVRLSGYTVLFSPQLTFKHFLTNYRLNWVYLKKLHAGFSRTYVVLNLYENALNNKKVHLFYWLKQGMYFSGLCLKYWPRYYFSLSKKEGTIKEIHLLTWKNIAIDYFKYNFKTAKMYNNIKTLKK
jgi:glycosyltransferase involved in cell wall biosynthesis